MTSEAKRQGYAMTDGRCAVKVHIKVAPDLKFKSGAKNDMIFG